MKRLFALLVLAIAVTTASFGQTDERGAKSDAILAKMRRIDLLNQILPILMTKKQIGDVLSAIEKARANAERTKKFEYETLLGFDKELDTTIKAGIEKGEMPNKDFVKKLTKTFSVMGINRSVAVGENVTMVIDAMKKTLNVGQIKAAAGALDVTYFEPGLKPEEWTQEKKLDVYVRVVILDPLAYDLLKEMFKAAKS